MKLLVTGASGLIGREFAKMASERHEVYSSYHETMPEYGKAVRFDITSANDIDRFFSSYKPDTIIHLAALTDVDRCEFEKELAMKVNYHATRMIAEKAAKIDAFMLYVSTDYVFDGEKGLYREDEPAHPINTYGLSKLRGENAIQQHAKEWCIARTSTPYGVHPARKSFPLFIAERLAYGEEVKALYDQYTSPTYVPNLAEMLLDICERRVNGIIHTVGANRISRYEVALKVAEKMNLSKDKIVKIFLQDMKWKANRPRDSSLSMDLARKSLNIKPFNFETGINLFIKELGKSVRKMQKAHRDTT